jgi:hypothetical protein
VSQQEPEVIRAEIDETRARLSQDVDTLAETARPSAVVGRRVEAAKEAVGGAKDKIMGRAEDVGHRMGEHASGVTGGASSGVSGVSDQMSRAAHGVTETVGRAPTAVRSRTEGSPLAAGLAAFGIGFLLGSLLPASRAEQQAAEKLGEVGEPVRRELGDSARSVAQDVKSEVTEAAQTMGESAKEAASAVTDAARQKSDN